MTQVNINQTPPINEPSGPGPAEATYIILGFLLFILVCGALAFYMFPGIFTTVHPVVLPSPSPIAR